MPLATKFTARARRELERALVFWRTERPAAPDLVLDELEATLSTLADAPHLGVRYLGGRPGTRRALLPQTRMHVYYAIRDENDVSHAAARDESSGRTRERVTSRAWRTG